MVCTEQPPVAGVDSYKTQLSTLESFKTHTKYSIREPYAPGGVLAYRRHSHAPRDQRRERRHRRSCMSRHIAVSILDKMPIIECKELCF